MAKNKKLGAAKKAKKDEFYTQLKDIANELSHYKPHFEGKTVFCNCDDPFESNFFRHFALSFNHLGLKKLITTSYSPTNAYKAIVTKTNNQMTNVRDVFKIEDNKLEKLNEDGDFRSKECLELLDESDIVVTNPPFSLFREYVTALVKYNKKFLIIGNQNAITYKEIFPLLKENKIWLGYGFKNGNAYFSVTPEVAANYARGVYDSATGLVKFRNCCWFTNLDIKKIHEEFVFIRRYSPEKYPKYDNYDAINVNAVVDIPCDYAGVMGVPITFMNKYNPDQFEIVGCSYNYGRPESWPENTKMSPTINGENVYKRIFIINKNPK